MFNSQSTPASEQGSITMDCKATKTQLADLLLDPAAATPAAREHVAACAECSKELQDLQKPFDLMTYPGAKHGLIRQSVTGLHAQANLVRFFDRELGAGPR